MKLTNLNLIKVLIIVLILLILITVFTLIYQNNMQYDLRILGSETVNLFLNEKYIEKGVIAYDRNNIDVSSKVIVSGNVDTNSIGTYKIKYQIGWVKKYRIVNVNYDKTKDITMFLENDNTIQYILKDNNYNELGCKAFDLIDGEITNKVKINSNVDTSKIGEYNVEYTVINSRGISKSISRKVIVYDINYDYLKEIVDGKYKVIFKFNDEYYQKTKLPDGSFNLLNEIEYIILQNGVYIFEIYDKFNNIKKVELDITDVDNVSPTGTCTVSLYNDNSKVKVEAHDNQKVKGYVYYYGDKQSELITSNSFSYSDMVNDVKVIIYDEFHNTTEIKCDINDQSTKYGRSYTTESNTYQYKLYIPPTLSKRNKLPLVIFLHGMGECGGSVNNVNANSFPKFINKGKDYDFVMIAPHLTQNNCKYLSTSVVKNIIDSIVLKYPIDSHRIIITGFSLGAINTYKMIKAYPTFFAGAIPVGEITSYDDSLLKTNIWSFMGTHDGYHDKAKALLEKIIQGNPNSKFTSIKGYHNITEEVYTNEELVDWIINSYRE